MVTRIVIISENDDLRLLEYSLSGVQDCKVRMYRSILVSLRELINSPAELIILDIKEMESGFNEILNAINQVAPKSQVMIISGDSSARIHEANNINNSNILYSFPRPFVLDELVGIVEAYIKRKSTSSIPYQKVDLVNGSIGSNKNPALASAQEVSSYINGLGEWADGDDYYIGRLLKAISNTEELTDIIVHACADKVKAEKCSLMLLDDNRQTLTVKKAKGMNESVIRNTKLRLGEGVAGLVALNGKALLVTDIRKEESFDSRNSNRYKSGSFISIPLSVQSDTIGILNFTDKINNHHFTVKDLHSLSTFASYAAIAIKTTLMFNKLQSLSITDELTGLYNRRHFCNCLENEIERSSRYNRYFTLAIFDVDNFKYYNDMYGHLAGDSILNQISNIFKTHTRNIDIVVRYGGEEFAVIYPETQGAKNSITNTSFGFQFPERIRIGVENHKFLNIVPHKKLNLTISGGVSIFPIDGKTTKELISIADENLYHAKREGRNRIHVGKSEGRNRIRIGRVYPHDYHIKILRGKTRTWKSRSDGPGLHSDGHAIG